MMKTLTPRVLRAGLVVAAAFGVLSAKAQTPTRILSGTFTTPVQSLSATAPGNQPTYVGTSSSSTDARISKDEVNLVLTGADRVRLISGLERFVATDGSTASGIVQASLDDFTGTLVGTVFVVRGHGSLQALVGGTYGFVGKLDFSDEPDGVLTQDF